MGLEQKAQRVQSWVEKADILGTWVSDPVPHDGIRLLALVNLVAGQEVLSPGEVIMLNSLHFGEHYLVGVIGRRYF